MPGETVVVTVPEDTPEPPAVVVEDSGASEVAPAVVAAETAEAVGEAVAETVAAIEAGRAAETVAEASGLAARVDGLESTLAALVDEIRASRVAAEVAAEEPVEVAVVEDETVPDRAHPWFRSLDSWRGNS
jgi:hypothetical protein